MNYASQDDATLMRSIAEARVEALAELYDRYGRLIYRVALAIVGHADIAEEITLDVFARAWQHAGRYRSEEARVSTWLIAIARHHAIDVLRRLNSRPEGRSLSWDEVAEVAEHPAVLADDPQEIAELQMQRAQIHTAVSGLPPEQRQVLLLAYFKGYTQREIAQALGQPLGTVKTRLRLAVHKLREALLEAPEGKSEPAADA